MEKRCWLFLQVPQLVALLQEAEQRRISEAKQRQHSVERVENLNNNMNSAATLTTIVKSTSNNNLPAGRGFQVTLNVVKFDIFSFIKILSQPLKGQWHEIFELVFFFMNQ